MAAGLSGSHSSVSGISQFCSDEDSSFSAHPSEQDIEAPGASLESVSSALQGSEYRRVSYMCGDVSASGTIRDGCPVGESSIRRLHSGKPLKSAMRKSSSSGALNGNVAMEMTALQISEQVKLTGRQ